MRVLLIACLGFACCLPLARAQDAGSVLIEGGRWFDTETGAFELNRGILVRDGSFVRVSEPLEAPPAGVRVLELEERHHLLPGFIDLHAH